MRARPKNPARKRTRTSKPATPEAYLVNLSEGQRAALRKLRLTIKSAAPKAEECISYGLPAFRVNGKFFVAYGVAANHCAFYPGSVVQKLRNELKSYDTGKGTIRFSPDRPLPVHLIRKIVRLRLAESR